MKLVEEEEKEEKVRLGILYVSIRRGSERGIAVHAMIGCTRVKVVKNEGRKKGRKENEEIIGVSKRVALKSCSSI